MDDLEIKTIATGSSGNCYHLKCGDDELLIEAGIPIKRIQKALSFDLSRVSGCLCTHSHGDHAKAVKDVLKNCVDVYLTADTANGIEVKHHRLKHIDTKEAFKVGGWSVVAFEAVHDCPGAVCFLIGIGGHKILFATDTAYIRYSFNGLTHLMIECNYDMDTMEQNKQSGTLYPGMLDRVVKTHFGLDNVLGFLEATDLSRIREIHLIHLSDGNANEQRIRAAVEGATGIPVIIP